MILGGNQNKREPFYEYGNENNLNIVHRRKAKNVSKTPIFSITLLLENHLRRRLNPPPYIVANYLINQRLQRFNDYNFPRLENLYLYEKETTVRIMSLRYEAG